MTTTLPTDLGLTFPADLTFPAEWTPHARTWTGWPFDDAYWEGSLEAAREDFAGLISTIAAHEPVLLACRDDESEQDARARLAQTERGMGDTSFFRLEMDDVWLRDSGPLFVRDSAGRVAGTDWRFNAWGGKYRFENDRHVAGRVLETLGMKRFAADIVMEGGALEINAQGVCLTTRQCLLNQNRNPNLSQLDLEAYLKAYLGVRHVVWLGEGLEGDKTDGHIDTITRWADDETILTTVTDDETDPNHAPLQANLTLLRALRQPGTGEPYRLLTLPLPEKRLELSGERLPLTYANFYIGNGFVVVPVYDDPSDAHALEVLRGAFPEREVIGLPSSGLITGGGSFHCVTQQQPAGEVVAAP